MADMAGKAEASPLHDLMKTTAVADYFGKSVAWFQRNNKRFGWLTPAATIGRSNLYRRADVEALHRKLHRQESNGHEPGRD